MTRDEIAARQEKRATRDGWRSPIVQGYYEDVAWLIAKADALDTALEHCLCRCDQNPCVAQTAHTAYRDGSA